MIKIVWLLIHNDNKNNPITKIINYINVIPKVIIFTSKKGNLPLFQKKFLMNMNYFILMKAVNLVFMKLKAL